MASISPKLTRCSLPWSFKCNNGECVPISKRCNGFKDCSDGSDELDCLWVCMSWQYRCRDTGWCLPSLRRCDGTADCLDMNDESYCCTDQSNGILNASPATVTGADDCPYATYFRCFDMTCIPRASQCNGIQDCSDNSDEADCPSVCQAPNFRCNRADVGSICLRPSNICDGIVDCPDLSDEANCCSATNDPWVNYDNQGQTSDPNATSTTGAVSRRITTAVPLATRPPSTTVAAPITTVNVTSASTTVEREEHTLDNSTMTNSTDIDTPPPDNRRRTTLFDESNRSVSPPWSYVTSPTSLGQSASVSQSTVANVGSSNTNESVILASTVIAVCVVCFIAFPLFIWCRRRVNSKSIRPSDRATEAAAGTDAFSMDSTRLSINDLVRSMVAMQTFGYDLERRGYDETSNLSEGSVFVDSVTSCESRASAQQQDDQQQQQPSNLRQEDAVNGPVAGAEAPRNPPRSEDMTASQRLAARRQRRVRFLLDESTPPPERDTMPDYRWSADDRHEPVVRLDVDDFWASMPTADILQLMVERQRQREVGGGPWFTRRSLRPAFPGQTNIPLFVEESEMRSIGSQRGAVYNPAPQLMLYINGEYVWIPAAGLLDAFSFGVLQNLQTDPGPPPAAPENIQALPTVNLTNEKTGASGQCCICLEDFQVDESVKRLPCSHIYHSECIVPWLQLNGTCPSCREPINHAEDTDNAVADTST